MVAHAVRDLIQVSVHPRVGGDRLGDETVQKRLLEERFEGRITFISMKGPMLSLAPQKSSGPDPPSAEMMKFVLAVSFW